jgi:hypothetical protein
MRSKTDSAFSPWMTACIAQPGLGNLAKGLKASVTIIVTVDATGPITNRATVAGNQADPNPANNSATAVSAGTISVKVAPPSIGFTAQTVDTTSASRTVTITNTNSTASLAISGITITGTDPADFAETNNCVSPVSPGGSCSISVAFKPTMIGTRKATLTINDVDGTTNQQTVPLSGTGK